MIDSAPQSSSALAHPFGSVRHEKHARAAWENLRTVVRASLRTADEHDQLSLDLDAIAILIAQAANARERVKALENELAALQVKRQELDRSLLEYNNEIVCLREQLKEREA